MAVVECLPSVNEALGSSPGTRKKKCREWDGGETVFSLFSGTLAFGALDPR